MEINKEIFFTFLESKDWNNEKTYNLFNRIIKEHIDKIKDLEDDFIFYKDKFDEMKEIANDAINKYDNSLKLCEKLKNENDKLSKKNNKTISTQTYIHNIEKAAIDYNIPSQLTLTNETSLVTNKNSIKNLNLDVLWEKIKDIINSQKSYKEKNKEMLILFCEYKKELTKLMGKIWYKRCVKCVEVYSKIKEEENVILYKSMIKLLGEVFNNDW